MPKPRRTRSPAELVKASLDLHYEFSRMCGQTIATYQERANEHPHEDFADATLEAALIHARILMFFLGWDRGDKAAHDDDVILEDFSPTVTPAPQPNSIPPTFKVDVDKRLGHLTYTRGASPRVRWELIDVAIAIRGEVLRVLAAVPPTLLHPAWQPLLAGRGAPSELDEVRAQVLGPERYAATGGVLYDTGGSGYGTGSAY